MKLGRLYVILDSTYLARGDFPRVAEKVVRGGADVLQIRCKGWDPEDIKAVADEVYAITRESGVPLIINDLPHLGRLYDGVHVGADDSPYERARETVGDKIVGVSCYSSLETALEMQDKGADYVAFSSPYPSPTKPDKENVSKDVLKEASLKLKIPFYVIGGIDVERAMEMREMGVYGVAVVSAVLLAEDPEDATRRLRDAVYMYP